jgi:hypothetical protein
VAARVETIAGSSRGLEALTNGGRGRGWGCGMAGHQWPAVPIRHWRVKEDRKQKRDRGN